MGSKAVERQSPGAAERLGSHTLGRDVRDALFVWSGEAFVGMLPLLTHLIAGRYSTIPTTASEPQFQAEICILAVVTSGLSMLALLPFGPKARIAGFTPFTYWLFLVTLGSLIFSTMLYVFFLAEINRRTDLVTWATLATALFGSFGLTMEGELLGHSSSRIIAGLNWAEESIKMPASIDIPGVVAALVAPW
jgi:hypothetical protein